MTGERGLSPLASYHRRAREGEEPLAYLEAASRLLLYSLSGLTAEAEAPASRAHSLLIDAQLEELPPRVQPELRAADARLAGEALLALARGEEPSEVAAEALGRAGAELHRAGWNHAQAHGEPARLTGEQLVELEAEALQHTLITDRARAKLGAAAELELPLSEAEQGALRWLTVDGEQEGAPDDYVMTVSEVVSHAVEELAGRLEELAQGAGELAPEGLAQLPYESWQRVAAACLADDLPNALAGGSGWLPRREGEGR